jgi:hypothetical protein
MCNGIDALVQIIKPLIINQKHITKSETIDSGNRSLSGRRDAASRPMDIT